MRKYKRGLCIMLGIAATMGVISFTGCGAQTETIDASDTVGVHMEETLGTVTMPSEIVSVSDEALEHISVTVQPEVEQVVTEITTPAHFNKTSETSVATSVSEDDIEVTSETEATVSETQETTVEAVETTEPIETIRLNDFVTFDDFKYTWSADKQEESSTIVLKGSCEKLSTEMKINLKEGWVLENYGTIAQDEVPYMVGGIKANIKTPDYTIRLKAGAESYRYDDNVHDGMPLTDYEEAMRGDDIEKEIEKIRGTQDRADIIKEGLKLKCSEVRQNGEVVTSGEVAYGSVWTAYNDDKHILIVDDNTILGVQLSVCYTIEVDGAISDSDFESLCRELLANYSECTILAG